MTQKREDLVRAVTEPFDKPLLYGRPCVFMDHSNRSTCMASFTITKCSSQGFNNEKREVEFRRSLGCVRSAVIFRTNWLFQRLLSETRELLDVLRVLQQVANWPNCSADLFFSHHALLLDSDITMDELENQVGRWSPTKWNVLQRAVQYPLPSRQRTSLRSKAPFVHSSCPPRLGWPGRFSRGTGDQCASVRLPSLPSSSSSFSFTATR